MKEEKGPQEEKITLYIDVDDTILNTAETFIKKYCRENGIKKDFYDLKDWNFRSIDRNIDIKEFLNYIETRDFFEEVQFYDDFLRFYVRNGDKFNFVFITIGTEKNLELKREFIFKSLPSMRNIKFFGIKQGWTKDLFDMSGGIQIDDKYDNLNTNAKLKILQKNYIETDYNQVKEYKDNLYIMQDWKQIGETLEFINEHKDILNTKK